MAFGMESAPKFRIVVLIKPTCKIICVSNVNLVLWIHQDINKR